MITCEAVEWVHAHDDGGPFDLDELREAFAILMGREPDDENVFDQWSLCCAEATN